VWWRNNAVSFQLYSVSSLREKLPGPKSIPVLVKFFQFNDILVQPLWKTVWRFLKKLKIELPYNPAIALLGIYPKDTKIVI